MIESRPPNPGEEPRIDIIVGRNIARLRQASDTAVADLARWLDIDAMMLMRLEAGELRAPAQLLGDIAQLLSVSVAQFFVRPSADDMRSQPAGLPAALNDNWDSDLILLTGLFRAMSPGERAMVLALAQEIGNAGSSTISRQDGA